ncbi:MAG: radical SAM protein, partial [Candidatus Latescibacterota bacterium]
MDSRIEKAYPRMPGITRRRFLACGFGACAMFGPGGRAAVAKTEPFPGYPAGPKEALFYERLGNDAVRCGICPRRCRIPDGERGFCRTRENRGGKLYSLVYGRVAAMQTDPVEKKPLFHFLPGDQAFSIATAGCNFTCKFCQNYHLSQSSPEEVRSRFMTPGTVASEAAASGARLVAFTYNEPT